MNSIVFLVGIPLMMFVFTMPDVFAEKVIEIPLKSEQFYHILRASVEEGLRIDNVQNKPGSGAFEIFVTSTKNSNLTLWVPRDILKPRIECKIAGAIDLPFIVIDGKEVQKDSVREILNDSVFLEIPVAKKSKKIQIIITLDDGYWKFPEGCPIEYFDKAFSYNSPLKQIENNVNPLEIVCRYDLSLILRMHSASKVWIPSCVKSETSEKLIYRGWNVPGERFILYTDKTEYKIGEPIIITLKNIGSKRLVFSTTNYGIEILHNNKFVCCIGGDAASYLAISEENIWELDFLKSPGDYEITILGGGSDPKNPYSTWFRVVS